MIESYRGLAVFVAVADAGGLSAAGRRLNLSTSVVSYHLSRLEARMGAALFRRSTRAISLTAEGEAALEPARRMVAAGEDALDAISAGSGEPVGTLHIAMPAWGEQTRLHRRLWDFARRHPMVAISVQNSDEQSDLIREGFDLAIRLGRLADSGLKSRRIADFTRLLVASPEYLASRPAVVTFEDLAACDFISISRVSDEDTYECEGQSFTFNPKNVRLEVNSIGSAKSALLAGLGVRLLPLGAMEDEIASGSLVQLLPMWRVPDMGVYAVWPHASPEKALVRRLIEFFVDDSVNLVEGSASLETVGQRV